MSAPLVALGSAWQAWIWPWLLEGTVVSVVLFPLLRWPRLSPGLRSAVAMLALVELLVPWRWRPTLPWRFPALPGEPPGDTSGLAGGEQTGAWLGVVALLHGLGMILALAIGARRLHALRSLGRDVADTAPDAISDATSQAALRAELADVAARIGLRRVPELRVTPHVAAPCVAGWPRPVVALPPSVIEGLTRPELRAVLAHELVHLLHRDLWRSRLRTLAASLWWFHPVVRHLMREAAEIAELRCDDSVVALGLSAPSTYRDALLEVAGLASQGREHVALVAATGVHRLPLGRRLQRLSSAGVQRRTRLTSAEWLVTGLLAGVVLARAASPAESAQSVAVGASEDTGLVTSIWFVHPHPSSGHSDHAARHRAAHGAPHREAQRHRVTH